MSSFKANTRSLEPVFLNQSFVFTILSGQTESDAHDLGPQSIVSFEMPAAFTGTSLTFKISKDGDTFRDYYDAAGAQISVTVAADRHIGIVPSDFVNCQTLKLVSDAAEAADRKITVTVRSLA